MKHLPTQQGIFSFVDDENFDDLTKHKWRAKKDGHTFYADTNIKRDGKYVKVALHRLIMSAPLGMEVDHIDGNGLNNQRINLRLCTKGQNQHNRRRQSNKSGYKGVVWHKRTRKWQAQIMSDGKYKYLGVYYCLVKAAKAYDKAAKEYFGDFAKLNFPENEGI